MYAFAGRLARLLGPGSIVLLDGPLGVGKTTLCQALAKRLGVDEPITSPSYSLIQEYLGRLPVFHMDLYRISNEEEFELIGGFEYLDQGGVCLIEWGRRLERIFSERDTIRLELDFAEKGRVARWWKGDR